MQTPVFEVCKLIVPAVFNKLVAYHNPNPHSNALHMFLAQKTTAQFLSDGVEYACSAYTEMGQDQPGNASGCTEAYACITEHGPPGWVLTRTTPTTQPSCAIHATPSAARVAATKTNYARCLSTRLGTQVLSHHVLRWHSSRRCSPRKLQGSTSQSCNA